MTATRPSSAPRTPVSPGGPSRAGHGRPVRVLGGATWLNLVLVAVVAGREIGSVLGEGSSSEDPLVGARVAMACVLVLLAAYGVVCLQGARSREGRRRQVLLTLAVLALVPGLACGAACLQGTVSAMSPAAGLVPGPEPLATTSVLAADLLLAAALGAVLWALALAGAGRLAADVVRARISARHRDIGRGLT